MKENIKKYGVIVIVVIVLLISMLMYDKPVEETVDDITTPTAITTTIEYIYVDIKGEVLNPGVYKIEKDTRLFYVVELAGGLTHEANHFAINLSSTLDDEDIIVIPNINDIVLIEDPISNPNDELLNINTADINQLQSLPGVGPSTAQKIIDYRDDIAEFAVIEDLMNVSGIGEATFNEIKLLIKV